MLDSLHSIVRDVSAAPNLDAALGIIVHRVREELGVDVCSFYVSDHQACRNVLMATEGLRADAVGRIGLGFGEGLVGLVAEREEPVNLDDAARHPRFAYIPESGEGDYHAFLGAPVIHQRKVLGVLVVQQKTERKFDESDVAFLSTLAAQLSGAIAYASVNGELSALQSTQPRTERKIDGLPGAPGVALGVAVVVYAPTDLQSVPDRAPRDPAQEELSLRNAVAGVSQEMKRLVEKNGEAMSTEQLALFDVYDLMLHNSSIVDDTVRRIHAGNWAPGALRDTIDEHAHRFEEMEDLYLRERASDLYDIGRRILMHLQDKVGSAVDYPENTILVGEQVSAIDLADVPPHRLTGVVSGHGSALSHVSILAHDLGLPAVMGIGKLPVARFDGQELVVDGYRGLVYIRPGPLVRSEFARLAREERELSEELHTLHDLPPETPDGVRIPLHTNTGLYADTGPSLAVGADGIGLYRTELPFMVRQQFPGEEEQLRIYRDVLEAFAPLPVVMRTLDAGGDKVLPYFHTREANPALGWRGIRMTLDHPEIFLTQLRAALRASSGLDNLSLLFPMISGVAEIDEALELFERAYAELQEEGVALSRPQLGAMMEVPSAVYQADALAKRVDFLSIGTNDLTQYLLAVDRNNPHVAKLFDSLHPAVLRAVMEVIEAGHRSGKPVSVCGETAGDPAMVVLLLGMGIDSLSVSTGDLPRIKWVIRSFTRRRAREILDTALTHERPEPIRALLNEALEEAGLGGLVRAGK